MVFLVTVEYTFNYVQTRFYLTKFFILEQKVSIKLRCFNILESCTEFKNSFLFFCSN